MHAGTTGGRLLVFGTVLAVMLPLGAHPGHARSAHHHYSFHRYYGYFSRQFARMRSHHRVYYARHPVLQCVTFVREETGVQLGGNAVNWWGEADGLYARGNAPEEGAVLSFRGIRRMRLGHVAVVSRIVGPREIEVEHAHWAGNGIRRDVSVIDVSPDNDWTAVRVELARAGTYGSVYATNGFIFDRPPEAKVQLVTTTTPGTDTQPERDAAAENQDEPAEADAPMRVLPHHARHHRQHWATHRARYTEVAQEPPGRKLNFTLRALAGPGFYPW